MPPRVRTLDEVDESRLLPWALASAAEARTALRHTLAGKEVSDRTVDEAVQVLSELVANAVQHGAPSPTTSSASTGPCARASSRST